MNRDKKLKILWSALAALFIAATAVFLAFGIRAAVLKGRSSEFSVDTAGKSVSAVCENDAYAAVGTNGGIVYLYNKTTGEEEFYYEGHKGSKVSSLAIDGNRLYAAFEDTAVCAFTLDNGEHNGFIAEYRLEYAPQQMFFGVDSNWFAVYCVRSNYRDLYFLPKNAEGVISYTDYIFMDQDTGLSDGLTGLVLKGNDVYFATSVSTVKHFVLPAEDAELEENIAAISEISDGTEDYNEPELIEDCLVSDSETFENAEFNELHGEFEQESDVQTDETERGITDCETLSVAAAPDGTTSVFASDYNILALAVTDDGYSAIDSEGKVYNFDSSFKVILSKKNKTGSLTKAFAAGDTFVCRQKSGGIKGVNMGGGIEYSVPTGNESRIIFASDDGFAYLTSDEGAFKYYTVAQAKKVQFNNKIFTPFMILGAIMLIVAVYAVISVFETTRAPMNGFFKKFGKTVYKHKFAYISLIPTFLLLAIFYWYPIVSSLFTSFFDYLPGDHLNFVGLDNFKLVFRNTEYWVSFKNTLIFLVTDLVKALLPPIIFAECLLALRSKRTSYIIRVLLFLPGILPGVASMLVWADGIFGSSSSGLLNGFLSAILPSWASKAWLRNDKTALASLIFMNFPWVGSYLIFFGAISGVNKEIYEASKLDGCGWWRRIVQIDIPLIVPQIKYIFIQTFISSVQNYTLILITTGGYYGTNTPALMMYYATAVQKNYGVASAMGMILLLFLMVATIINFKMQIGSYDGKKKKKNKRRLIEDV